MSLINYISIIILSICKSIKKLFIALCIQTLQSAIGFISYVKEIKPAYRILIIACVGSIFGGLLFSIVSAQSGNPVEVGYEGKSNGVMHTHDDSELRIIQATPQGDISHDDLKKEIVVVFNHPIVPLAKLEERTEGIFSVRPAPEGNFRWHGSRVCAFVPKNGYNPGAVYRVEVPKGIKALNGKTLSSAFRFEFSTPGLKVVNLSFPGVDSYGLPDRIEYDQSFQITFNYPVSLSDVEKNCRLKSGGRAIPFKLMRPTRASLARFGYTPAGADLERVVIVVPEKTYGRDEPVSLTILKRLMPAGGNVPMESDFEKEFITYGPLEASLDTEEISYFQDMWRCRLKFNNPVHTRDIIKNVNFSPKARWRWGEEGKSESMPLSAWELRPGTKYTIAISRDLKDAYGNSLRGENTFQLETPSYRPSLHTISDHVCIEALMAQKIPVDVANLEIVDVGISSFTFEELAASVEHDKYSLFENAHKISDIVWKTKIGPHQAGKLGFDFSSYLDASRRGWLAMQFSALVPGYNRNKKEKESYTIFVQSTDLGLTVKQGTEQSAVWVHSLASGSPMKGVQVSAYEGTRHVGRCITDSEGSCIIDTRSISKDDKVIFIAEAKNGIKDAAFVTARDHGMYMYSLADYSNNKHGISVNGVVVFDRKLYRPGDEMHFKAVFGLWSGGKYYSPRLLGNNAKVVIHDAEGNDVFDKAIEISDEGGVSGSFNIPEGAPVGHYTLYVSPGNSSEQRSEKLYNTFQVEEFRPVAFSVETKGIAPLRVKQKLRLEVLGKYLFGAPMQNVPVQLTVRRRPAHIFMEHYGEYLFGDDVFLEKQGNTYEYYASAEGKTNVAGVFPYDLVLSPMADSENDDLSISAPYELEIEARVSDVDNKSVTNVASCMVSAGNYIFGMRTDMPYRNFKQPFHFDLVALDNAGSSGGVADAQIIVHREEIKSIQSKGPGGSRQTENIRTVKVVHTSEMKLSHEPKKFTFQPPSAGTYIITVKEKNGLAATRMRLYAWGGDFGGWWLPNDDVVKLVADKDEYRPGETARVLVQSPFPKAQAIVTLERENVIWKKSMAIGNEGKPLEIPISQEYVPNVYVSVMLITPRAKDLPPGADRKKLFTEDLGIPRFKIGIVKLKVNTSSKKAKLDLSTDRSEYAPGDMVNVKIISEPHAEVALSVADRGVLDLVNYHYPDPVKAFYGQWPLFVRAIENRRFLVHQLVYALKGNAPGGGDGEGDTGFGGFHFDSEDGTRKNFKYTAYWNPMIKTDGDGNARVSFKLPDNLTTFRLLAIASAKGKYASREKEFVVRTPVVVQPLMPRFIRPGDEIELGTVIVNQTSRDAEFEVSIGSPLLLFNGGTQHDARKVVFIAKGASKEVTFPVKLHVQAYMHQKGAMNKGSAIEAKGLIRCEMKAKGDASGVKDQVAFSFPVREHPPVEAFAIAGFTDGAISEGVKIPSKNEVLDELGTLEIALSSTALTGLQKAFGFYASNPYFCLEQRASAFLCGISAGKLLQRFHFEPKKSDGYDFTKVKELFLDSLGNFQNSDGGFSLWSDSAFRMSSPYLSAYVVFVLQYARECGYDVDEEIYRKALDYLTSYVRRPGHEPEICMFENFALIYQILAKEKKNVRDLERVLLQNEQKLSLRAKGNLALGLASSRKVNRFDEDAVIERLVNYAKNRMDFTTRSISFREEPRYVLGSSFYSGSSTLGVLLRMFIALDSSNPLIPQIVRYAIDDRAGKLWNESHGAGNLAVALSEYARKYEKESGEFKAQVRIGDKGVFDDTLSAGSNAVSTKVIQMRDLLSMAEPGIVQPFAFSISHGKGRLYYSATLRYSPKLLTVQPRDEGIEIRKEIFRLKTGAKGEVVLEKAHTLARGELYLYRITVVNPKPYFNFLVSDPLPSNVEPVKSNFATESAAIDRFVREKREPQSEWWWEHDSDRYELRDDRVVISRNYLSPGIHEFYYLGRPVVKGKSSSPAAHAFLMYEPEVFGRTGSADTIVK